MQNAANQNGDTSEVSKSRKKTREERQLRFAAEQQLWLRQKFDFQESEQLIASFSAALFRHILLQGRMYITSSSICFYTKLFGKVTKETFLFSSMARVKKRRGGLVANAVKIFFLDTALPPVVIGSLNHRERAYSLIQERLRVLNPAAAEHKENDDDGSGASVASAPAECDDGYLDGDFQNDVDPSKPISLSSNHSRDDTEITRHVSNGLNSDPIGRNSNIILRNSDSSIPSSQNNSDIDPADISRHSQTVDDLTNSTMLMWATPDDVFDRVHGSAFAKKTERAQVVLNATVKEAFNELFLSEWLKQYHETSNNRDVTFTEWERAPDGYMTRVVHFRRPLAYKIGPKETRVKETQRYSFTGDGGVIVELAGENVDAPYGSYFVVETFFELTAHGDGSETMFVVSVALNFLKSTMLQSKIESGALSETKIAYQRLAELAASRMEEYRAEVADQPAVSTMPALTNNNQVSGRIANGVPKRSSPSRKVRSGRGQTSKPSSDSGSRHGAVPRSESIVRDAGSLVGPGTTNGSEPAAGATTSLGSRGTDSGAETEPKATAAVEVRDASQTKWMRFATVGTLALTCILLFSVVGLLYRMHHGLRALEKMVAEAQRTGVMCTSETCAAQGLSVAGVGGVATGS